MLNKKKRMSQLLKISQKLDSVGEHQKSDKVLRYAFEVDEDERICPKCNLEMEFIPENPENLAYWECPKCGECETVSTKEWGYSEEGDGWPYNQLSDDDVAYLEELGVPNLTYEGKPDWMSDEQYAERRFGA